MAKSKSSNPRQPASGISQRQGALGSSEGSAGARRADPVKQPSADAEPATPRNEPGRAPLSDAEQMPQGSAQGGTVRGRGHDSARSSGVDARDERAENLPPADEERERDRGRER